MFHYIQRRIKIFFIYQSIVKNLCDSVILMYNYKIEMND